MILPIDSKHTKNTLKLSATANGNPDNLKILRHPGSFISLWSHHEKMVVVD